MPVKPSTALIMAVLMAGVLHAVQTQPIRADQAKSFVGQVVVIEDTVVQISREPQSGSLT